MARIVDSATFPKCWIFYFLIQICDCAFFIIRYEMMHFKKISFFVNFFSKSDFRFSECSQITTKMSFFVHFFCALQIIFVTTIAFFLYKKLFEKIRLSLFPHLRAYILLELHNIFIFELLTTKNDSVPLRMLFYIKKPFEQSWRAENILVPAGRLVILRHLFKNMKAKYSTQMGQFRHFFTRSLPIAFTLATSASMFTLLDAKLFLTKLQQICRRMRLK